MITRSITIPYIAMVIDYEGFQFHKLTLVNATQKEYKTTKFDSTRKMKTRFNHVYLPLSKQ